MNLLLSILFFFATLFGQLSLPFPGPGAASSCTPSPLGTNSNNGTYTGGVTISTVAGLPGDSATNTPTFDGSSGYVANGNILNMGLNNWTIIAWAKTTGLPSYRFSAMLVAKSLYGAQSGRWWLSFDNDTNNFETGFVGSGAEIPTYSNSGYLDGNWHCLIATYQRSGNLTLYVDGVSKATANISGDSGTNMRTTDYLLIGAYNNSTNGQTPEASTYFEGSIGHVAIVAAALTSTQAADIYAAGITSGSGYRATVEALCGLQAVLAAH